MPQDVDQRLDLDTIREKFDEETGGEDLRAELDRMTENATFWAGIAGKALAEADAFVVTNAFLAKRCEDLEAIAHWRAVECDRLIKENRELRGIKE